MTYLMSRTATRPALLGRLFESGWGARGLLVAAALVGATAMGYAANLASRDALWQVVRACALDKRATGSPLPCLEVKLSDGGAAGYAVLRPPIGKPDTILTPMQRIVGLEDPQLQAPGTPNYFALAWGERRWLNPEPAESRVALAVNSRLARSQDQLHVHIGCLAPDFAERLGDGGLGPRTGVWFHAPDMAPGLELWTYRTGARDLQGLAPFRLLKELIPGAGEIKRVTLGVALWKGEFVVAALHSRPGGWYAAAEDILDSRCR